MFSGRGKSMPHPKIWISKRKNNIMLLFSANIIDDSESCAALFQSPQPMSQIWHILLHWRTDRMLLVFSPQLPCQLSSLKASLWPRLQIFTILCVCVFVFWARRGSSVCSSQVLLRCLLRQTGGLWKPLVSTPQSIGTSIICLHVLEIPLNQPAAELVTVWLHGYWCGLLRTCTGCWEGGAAQA